MKDYCNKDYKASSPLKMLHKVNNAISSFAQSVREH